MNILRKQLENRAKIYGTLVSLTDPAICEIIGRAGFDSVWIDMEHTYMSYKDVLCHLNASASANISSLVRLPQNDPTATKKILEMGPDAILFPMVKSASEAKELIESTLYPPNGIRGFGPMRAIGYGAIDAKRYAECESLELCRFIQIESKELLAELDELVKIPYLDGCIFGPNDLSGSLGSFLDVNGEATVGAIRNAIEILHKNGLVAGLAGGADEKSIKLWCSLGIDMIYAGADWCFIYSMGNDVLKTEKKYLK